MKLFGNSKNGKHTPDGAQSHPEHGSREFEEPPVEREEQPHRKPTMVPERPTKTPVPQSKEHEEDVFNSIVQAVGMADSLSPEPEPQSKQPEPPVKRPEPVPAPKKPEPPATPPMKRPEPVELFPDMDDENERHGMSAGKKVLAIVGTILGFLLLVVVAAILVFKLWQEPPNIDDQPDYLSTPVPTVSFGEDNPDIPPEQNPSTGRKKNNYTFVIAGVDVASGNTDVILIGKLDTSEGTLNVVSIPRDTLMNYGTYKINNAYAIGVNTGKGGVENLKKELKKLMGFEIDNYAIVDTKAVAEIIDAIGGVYFDVPQDMIYRDPYQNLDINISKGYQLLSGADAVKVLRYRHGYAGGDIQRIGVQQEFFKAVAKQFLDVKNIPNLPAAIKVYTDNVTTDLNAKNVMFYMNQFLALDFDNIQFMTLPGKTDGEINGGSYVFIYVDEWLQMVNDYLNPFYDQVTENHVSIKTSTNGSSFVYTAGANQ